MSRLEEIKEQLKTQLTELFDKIKESDLYQKASDKYESLSPSGQKWTKIATAFLLLFLVFSYPLSQWSKSDAFIAEYEEKRNLIVNFFRAYRNSGAISELPPSQSTDDTIQAVRGVLNSAQILPEQIVSVTPAAPFGTAIPTNALNGVVEVQLAQLNLRQTVDIGTQLGNISQTIKVKDLMIKADSAQSGYFSVTYKLYSLKMPDITIAEEEPATPPKGRGRSNNRGDD